ncbi:MAG: hypothetical protein J7485_11195 [Sphingobium sp.]|nr:hypothetical protein [Sphingobium sp.]
MMCDNRIMARMFRILLVLLLAIPAAQLGAHPADAAPARMEAMHHMAGHHSHERQTPSHVPAVHHDCIGCIAPIDVGLYRPVSQPFPDTRAEPRPANAAFLLARSTVPETPPPRTTA